jgi:hypothetical protein
VAMNTIVGDGNTTLFWIDNWLHGSSFCCPSPSHFCPSTKRVMELT